jgi:hypothetical protein
MHISNRFITVDPCSFHPAQTVTGYICQPVLQPRLDLAPKTATRYGSGNGSASDKARALVYAGKTCRATNTHRVERILGVGFGRGKPTSAWIVNRRLGAISMLCHKKLPPT